MSMRACHFAWFLNTPVKRDLLVLACLFRERATLRLPLTIVQAGSSTASSCLWRMAYLDLRKAVLCSGETLGALRPLVDLGSGILSLVSSCCLICFTIDGELSCCL
ncbi:unnamed protein product [Moneuplotes crassus]|uniref:Uncharacterized protein n=1 Tax=Euplotes crassus TaxID=5936 RepID=A0AAD1UE75_EUPCR|nr:unnamed protein product [Moneuplotes crassus]